MDRILRKKNRIALVDKIIRHFAIDFELSFHVGQGYWGQAFFENYFHGVKLACVFAAGLGRGFGRENFTRKMWAKPPSPRDLRYSKSSVRIMGVFRVSAERWELRL